MNMDTEKKMPLWRRTLVRRLVLGVVWAVALFGAAIPVWQKSLINQREIEAVEKNLANLDQWTVAGMWLERSVTQREPRVSEIWQRLFPVRRDREQLFLDLARVADHAGVRHFDLIEERGDGMPGADVWQDGSSMGDEPMGGPGESVEMDMATPGAREIEMPEVVMDSYRVKATFHSDYNGTAAFLGGLHTIDRALSLHNLVIRPMGELIQVDMELDVYVSEATES